MFHIFLKSMALVEFGDFDIIGNYFKNTSFVNTPELATINVSQLMLDVSRLLAKTINIFTKL
jgi:hypothetical protein